jgi:hypothetical protein
MPFTLEQLDFLGLHVGVVIPPEFLEHKRRAEEFKTRREAVTADAAGKPAAWRLKTDLDAVLLRAAEAAAQKQFNPAFKLLDEAEQLLKQPDLVPAPQPVVEQGLSAPPPPAAASTPPAVVLSDEFRKQWAAARQAWEAASGAVDAQLAQLQGALKKSKDEDFQRIAEYGLNAVTGNFKVPLMAALIEMDGISEEAFPKTAARTRSLVARFRKHIETNEKVAVCDDNPFGVKVSVRQTMGGGLARLEEALAVAA